MQWNLDLTNLYLTKNLDKTNGILCSSNSKIYEKQPRYDEPFI